MQLFSYIYYIAVKFYNSKECWKIYNIFTIRYEYLTNDHCDSSYWERSCSLEGKSIDFLFS